MTEVRIFPQPFNLVEDDALVPEPIEGERYNGKVLLLSWIHTKGKRRRERRRILTYKDPSFRTGPSQ